MAEFDFLFCELSLAYQVFFLIKSRNSIKHCKIWIVLDYIWKSKKFIKWSLRSTMERENNPMVAMCLDLIESTVFNHINCCYGSFVVELNSLDYFSLCHEFSFVVSLSFSLSCRQIYVSDILETLLLVINLAVDMGRKVFAPSCGQILICHFLVSQECAQIWLSIHMHFPQEWLLQCFWSL